MSDSRVLVVGATGQLGSAIARKLIAGGVKVRALARNQEARSRSSRPTPSSRRSISATCRSSPRPAAASIRSSPRPTTTWARGRRVPARIDLSGYQNLCAAARNTGVRRLVYVSFKGVSQDAPVDIFRIKWYIEDAIRRSGVPHVMLRPTAFMDIWLDEILVKGIREKGRATIFGDGTNVANYIAVDDVAEFAVKILSRGEVVNEAVDAGGPSNMCQNDLAALLERQLKTSGKRRHVPVAALRLLPPIVRPFNEVAARLMTLGLYSATESTPFPGYRKSADRFGVAPRTVETYIEEMAERSRPGRSSAVQA